MDTPFQKRVDSVVYSIMAFGIGAAIYGGVVLGSRAWPLLIWFTLMFLVVIALVGGKIRRSGGNVLPPT